MSFANLVASLDTTVQTTFSDFPVTVHPQDGSPDLTLSCVTKNPALEDDYVPGNQPGPTVLLLFVHPPGSSPTQTLPLAPAPRRGDTATVNGIDYDIFQLDVDREGGMCLRMRQRSAPWYL